jgi:hypothetical protein
MVSYLSFDPDIYEYRKQLTIDTAVLQIVVILVLIFVPP